MLKYEIESSLRRTYLKADNDLGMVEVRLSRIQVEARAAHAAARGKEKQELSEVVASLERTLNALHLSRLSLGEMEDIVGSSDFK